MLPRVIAVQASHPEHDLKQKRVYHETIRSHSVGWSGLFVAMILLPTNVCSAEDTSWPFVRGPHFDGHSDETDIVDGWADDGPPVLWTRNLGQGYSAFVAADDRIYTQAQNMTGQYVYCLQSDTGETIWEHWYDWPYETAGVYPGPRSTPTLDDGGRIYFTSPDGLLGCLDHTDGRQLWSVDLLKAYGIEGCDFGYACSPTVIKGRVILPVGGAGAGVVAFDSKTGAELWKATSEPASYTPAYPIELKGIPLVVCYMQNALLVLDQQTGNVRHRVDLSQGYDEHSAWPIYSEPNLWLSAPFKAGSYVLDISGERATGPTTVWRSKSLSNDVCSSVLVDGHIYGFDIFDVQSKTHRPSRGIFRCVDFSSGTENWSVGTGRPRRSSNEEEFASDIGQCGIIAADGKLIILNELGELILLQADPQRCIELARCSVLSGELTWTAPCLNDGRLYIRNQSRAMCVYLGNSADVKERASYRAADLPQRQYYNLAAMVLAVEPEYAFDIPHNRWLILWYWAGAGLLVGGKLLSGWISRDPGAAGGIARREFFVVASLGALGTTVLGHMSAEFVFTWPVCLFAALEFVAQPEVARAGGAPVPGYFRRRLPLLTFLVVNVLYFLACRRLSLVFEWAFLFGFVGALPSVWVFNRVPRFTPQNAWLRLLTSVVSYTLFYTAAVLFLKSRY